VNAYTTGSQRHSGVAVHDDGSFVVTWLGHSDAFGQDGFGIVARRFGADDVPLGGEAAVNAFTIDAPTADVSARGGGAFVVVWDSGCYVYGLPSDECSLDGSGKAVGLRRFDATGAPEGVEEVANVSTLGNQRIPRIDASPTGDFVVVWRSEYAMAPGVHYQTVARRFSAAGAPLGGDLIADAGSTTIHRNPDVAVDGAGNFVVVWLDYVYGNYTVSQRVLAQRYDAAGAPVGDEIEVANGDDANLPAVAAAKAPNGQFVVVWEAHPESDSYYSTGPQREVRGRRFASDGTPLGAEFAVNTYTTDYQWKPAVASDAAGNFLVTWMDGSYFGSGVDGHASGVGAQAFAHDGVPLGHEIQVNVFTRDGQPDPTVGGNAAGQFVVTWTSQPYYGAAQDGSQSGIFARRLALRPCSTTEECDDADPCTSDACEGGICLNRRLADPGCCQIQAECRDDGDPCTDEVCAPPTCQHLPVPDCVPCSQDSECEAPDACTYAGCEHELGRCVFWPKDDCCLTAADCDDGHACTDDTCDASHACASAPVAECVECGEDADCVTGCLVRPQICEAGRCPSLAGCPTIIVDDADPVGAAARLLVQVGIPVDVPGKGKIKAVVTATVGALGEDETPPRRCRTGKKLGRTRAVLLPDTDTSLLLALVPQSARCLEGDADGAVPIDVTVVLKRKKVPVAEMTEPRTWRR
jgi:hypothetical protein